MASPLNSSSKPPVNYWDNPTDATPQDRKALKPTVTAVRDDWEDDDDEEEDQDQGVPDVEEGESPSVKPVNTIPTYADENRKIWETANTRSMPTLLTSRTSSVIPPPAAAFQPTMQILKRPQSSSSTPTDGNSTPSSLTGESLQEREARYAAARERIFGSENPLPPPEPPNSAKIIREPKVPESASGGQSLGFKGRGGKSSSSART